MQQCTIDSAILEEIQWHWKPYDDYYHTESGYYCPNCFNDKHKGHESTCEIYISLTRGNDIAQDA